MAEPITYRDAGVDIDAGNELVDKIKNIVAITKRPGVLGGIGGFGGCFSLSQFKHLEDPVLVSSTDGVGTKLRLAIELNRHHTIGIDLVAMCANDLVVMGAEPLYFLDYFATGKLDVSVAESVITGIANGCKTANCALIGGETAEMPGMYAAKDYDLAGFCVGIVEKKDIIDGSLIKEGDALIALASSGPHSNGYSLIRHILKTKNVSLDEQLDGIPLAQTLLTPTRIYVKSLLALAKAKILKGAAHITGGGFIDNIPRILPENCAAFIDTQSWQLPSVFAWLQAQGGLSTFELRRTLNCGVGMVVCVAKENVAQTLTLLKENGETPWVLGHVITRKEPALGVEFSDAQ
ncbi:MAG: phosphoribosylformylglycinamidine cyclo-ligase [Gammaproteobacteria bacterium]|jgi:phosphoribosylformylglycinamidine cyclo-ligase|nr:phosphoribosylformylglycinamidine cyclo-ligase [Gammaproteobacteria bacterium]